MKNIGLGYFLLTHFNVIYDENATLSIVDNKQQYDYSQVKKGFVFDKKLSKPLTFELPVVNELRTIFNGKEDKEEQILKVFVEYLSFFFLDKEGKTLKSPISHFEEVKSKVKLVKVLNKEEFAQFIQNLAYSNLGLYDGVLSDIYAYTQEKLGKEYNFTPIELSEKLIKNKEIKLFFIKEKIKKREDVNGYELIRYITSKITDKTLYIHANKDSYNFQSIFNDIRSIKENQWYSKSTKNNQIKELFKYEDNLVYKNLLDNLIDIKSVLNKEKYRKNLASVYFTHIKTFIWLRNLINTILQNEELEKGLKFKDKTKEYLQEIKLNINKIKRLASKKSFKKNRVSFKVDFYINNLLKAKEEQKRFFEEKQLTLRELLKLYAVVQKEKHLASINLKDEDVSLICFEKNENIKPIKKEVPKKENEDKLYLKDYTIRNGKVYVKNISTKQIKNYDESVLLEYIKKGFEKYIQSESYRKSEELKKRLIDEKLNKIKKEDFSTLASYEEKLKNIKEHPYQYLTQEEQNQINFVKNNQKIVLRGECLHPIIFSDKKKLGEFYFGSVFHIEKHDSIGIVWDLDIDYDLSLKDEVENKYYSWCEYYGNAEENSPYIHSGDCRSAGSEQIKINRETKDLKAYLEVNKYSSEENEDKNIQIFIKRGNEFIFLSEKFKLEKNNHIIGYIRDGKFILDVKAKGKGRVASLSNNLIELTKENQKKYNANYVKVNLAKILNNAQNIYLEDILDKLGFEYLKKSMFEFKNNKKNNEDKLDYFELLNM